MRTRFSVAEIITYLFLSTSFFLASLFLLLDGQPAWDLYDNYGWVFLFASSVFSIGTLLYLLIKRHWRNALLLFGVTVVVWIPNLIVMLFFVLVGAS